MAPTVASWTDSGFGHWVVTNGLAILVIVVAAAVVTRAGTLAVRRLHKRLEGAEGGTDAINLRRTVTVTRTMNSTIRVIVWSLAGLLILGELGVNLAPLIAGAGIAGVALGFGAQTMVRDFLAGFYILLEDQYSVGNTVEITALGGVIRGRVEAVTLRSSAIRGDDGTVYTVGNGNIQFVANLSRGHGRVTVDVRVADHESVPEVRRLLDEVFREMAADRGVSRSLSAAPTVTDEELATDGTVLLMVSVETRPSRREEVERDLRRRIDRRLRSSGVGAGLDGDD